MGPPTNVVQIGSCVGALPGGALIHLLRGNGCVPESILMFVVKVSYIMLAHTTLSVPHSQLEHTRVPFRRRVVNRVILTSPSISSYPENIRS